MVRQPRDRLKRILPENDDDDDAHDNDDDDFFGHVFYNEG